MIFDIDIEKEIFKKKSLKQFDRPILELNLYTNGRPYNLVPNLTITLNARNSLNQAIVQTTGITYTGNTITIDLIEDIVRVAGLTTIEVVLDTGTRTITTFDIVIDIKKSVLEQANLEPSIFVDIVEVCREEILKLNEAVENGGYQAISNKTNQALTLASNPLNSILSAGYKVKPSECDQSLLALITGTANLQIGQGIIVNKGQEYPLNRVMINNILDTSMNDTVKNCILDLQVINANPLKTYQLSWLGNGYTGFGDNGKYGFQIVSFDTETMASSTLSRSECVGYRDTLYSAPVGIVTRVLKSKVDNAIFVITVDYSALGSSTFLSTTVFGTSVIHSSKYLYTSSNKKDLSINKGMDYPLCKIEPNSPNLHADVINAILDIKVINAKPNKIYKLEWLGNGTTAWGTPSYAIYINEYNETDITLTNPRIVFERGNFTVPNPTNGINTITMFRDGEDITISITIDYSKLNIDRYPMNVNNGAGSKHIIDKSCYLVSNKATIPVPPVSNASTVGVYFRGNQDIDVKFPYDDTKNLVLNFGKLGINMITHFKKVSYCVENGFTLDFNVQDTKYDITSDWLSPYGIKANNNIPTGDGYGGAYTVGGNHGTTSGGGFPTSESISTQVFVDGIEIQVGAIIGGKEVIEILTKNYIYASNVNSTINGQHRNSVIETVLYKIYKDTIYVTVSLEALEDVTISRYCGFQMTAPPISMQDKLYFMTENKFNDYKVTDYAGTEILSCEVAQGDLDRFIYYGANDFVVGYRDRNVGISDFRYLDGSENAIFKSTLTKVYMHNISQKNPRNVPLKSGNVMYWGGGYTFGATGLNCNRVKKAYTIREKDKRVYCIDFDKSTNGDTFLETFIEDRGKFIKVLQKSMTVNCDDFISPKGLKVSSTGYGQLKFYVE